MTNLETDGVTIIKRVAHEAVLALRPFDEFAAGAPGARNFDCPDSVSALIAGEGALGSLASALAGYRMNAVRVLFFDKTPAANWSVPWHQDRTIAVRQHYDVPGFGPWSSKDGVVHVEPPVAVLQDMLTLRLFVDDCGVDNGPLAVARGSHRLGRVPAADVKAIAERSEIFVGTGRSGDVLAMKLLAIHSSRRSTAPGHRRVLHVDYAAGELPAPLELAIAL